MEVLRSFFRIGWIACCALTLLAQTRFLLGISLAPGWLDGFVFGGTVFGYHFHHPRLVYRSIAWALGGLGGLCFVFFLLESPSEWLERLLTLAPLLFWLAYYGFQKPGNAGLRGHPVAKPLTIALTWAWVTVLLPIPLAQWPSVMFILLGRAAFIFALALAYDLSDAAYDRRHGLQTLTGKLGFEKSIWLIYWGLAISGLCVCLNIGHQVYPVPAAVGLLLSLLFSAWWLPFLLQKTIWARWQKPLIDALMVWQFLLVWACSIP